MPVADTARPPVLTDAPATGSTGRASVIRLAAVACAVAVSLNTALGLARDAPREVIIVPVAAVLGIVLAGLALVRFEVFVLGLLAVRASADIGKLSPAGSGLFEPTTALAMLFLIAALLWLTAHRGESPGRFGSPLSTALCLFLVAGVLSTVGSSYFTASAVDWLRLASAATMFFVLVRLIRTDRDMRRVLAAVFCSAAVPLVVGLAAALAGGLSETKGGFTRITSTFTQSNGYSRYLMLLIVVAVALYRHVGGWARPALALLLAASAVSLVLTYTRSSWLGAIVGILLVGILQSRRIVVGAVAVSVVALVAVPSVGGRFADLTEESSASGPTNSLSWRFGYWADVLPLANRNPVTGIGFRATQFETNEAKLPHNDFLRAYVETGIVGLCAYLVLLGALVRTARRALRRARPGFERGVAVGFAGFVVAFIAVSTVANVLSQVVMLWYLLAVAASAEAIARGLQPVDEEAGDARPVPMGAPA